MHCVLECLFSIDVTLLLQLLATLHWPCCCMLSVACVTAQCHYTVLHTTYIHACKAFTI